jgi:hypothetical protein
MLWCGFHLSPRIYRLCERTNKTGRREDPLYAHVCRAQQAMHDLYVELHYACCKTDVYRDRRK